MSSSRTLLVVALACALGALLWLSLRGGPRRLASVTPSVPSEDTPRSPSEAAPSFAERPAPESQPAAPEPTASPPAVGAESPAAPALTEPAKITLYGFVIPPEGRVGVGEAWVSLTDRLGDRQRVRAAADGAYALSGLLPGPYWVASGSPRGLGQAKSRVELDASENERRLDLELVLPPELRIRAVDGEGGPLTGFSALCVATLEPPGEWFTEVVGSFNNPFGVGQFWQSGFATERLPEGYLGTVILDVEPPVHVSLLNYHCVVATQRVEPGQREVEFVIDRDDPLLSRVDVRFHFVDAVTGERLESPSATLVGDHLRMLQPVEGEFRAQVAPGWHEVSGAVEGYETGRRRVLVEPGRDNDFGAIPLERAVWIAGQVVDDTGQGVVGTLRLGAFEGETHTLVRHFSGTMLHSKIDGTFRIGGLSRRIYFLSFEGTDSPWGRTAKRIDTRAGPVENVRFDLARGVPLVVRPSGNAIRDVRYEIFDAGGNLVLSSRLWSEDPYPISLAPGAYEIEVRVAGAETRRIAVTLATEPVELALP